MKKTVLTILAISAITSLSASAEIICTQDDDVKTITVVKEGPYNDVYRLQNEARLELAQKIKAAASECKDGARLIKCGDTSTTQNSGSRPNMRSRVVDSVTVKCD